MTLSSIEIGIAAVLFSLMNIIYAYMQDRMIFPITLEGYEDYQKHVPFLIPTIASIKRSLQS